MKGLGFSTLVFVCASLFGAHGAAAHPLDPILLEIVERPSEGNVVLALRAPVRGTDGLDINEIGLPDSCRPDGAVEEWVGNGVRSLRWEVRCGARSLAGQEIEIESLSRRPNTLLLRTELAEGATVQRVIASQTRRVVLPERVSRGEIFWSYGDLGFRHVLSGVDHLLFVLGLLLLVRDRRRLLVTITAFTVGHSITLAAAVLDAITVDPNIVEVLIAGSLVLLARDLVAAFTGSGSPGLFAKHPGWIAGAFGLLHGLGFAGALESAGLPADEVPLALVAFNLGIEAGQLVFIAAVLAIARVASLGLAQRLPPGWRVVPAYAIGTLAFAWVIERSLAALGLR